MIRRDFWDSPSTVDLGHDDPAHHSAHDYDPRDDERPSRAELVCDMRAAEARHLRDSWATECARWDALTTEQRAVETAERARAAQARQDEQDKAWGWFW